jgi:hypothetical protein
MAYLGNAPARSFISFEKQVFTIVNSQTAYTLSHSVVNENDIRLVVNNVVQEPGSGKAYTASGTTLTLSAALTNGTDEMYCVFLGRALQTVNPPNASVGNSQTAPTIITGQTAETSIATDDTILIHDTSASALKKMTRANFVSGIGGTNTPNFFASHSNDQTMNDNTITKITYDNEVFDTGSNYDVSNYRYTPGFVGKSFIGASAWSSDAQTSIYSQEFYLYKNGSALIYQENEQASSREWSKWTSHINVILSHNATDYYEVYGKVNTNDGGTAHFPTGSGNNATFRNFFYGYKIIE